MEASHRGWISICAEHCGPELSMYSVIMPMIHIKHWDTERLCILLKVTQASGVISGICLAVESMLAAATSYTSMFYVGPWRLPRGMPSPCSQPASSLYLSILNCLDSCFFFTLLAWNCLAGLELLFKKIYPCIWNMSVSWFIKDN